MENSKLEEGCKADWIEIFDKNIANGLYSLFFVGTKERRSGKTTALILASLKYNIPIISHGYDEARIKEERAHELILGSDLPKLVKLKYSLGGKVQLPRIMSTHEFRNSRGMIFENGILIDECGFTNFTKIITYANENYIKIRGGFYYM